MALILCCKQEAFQIPADATSKLNISSGWGGVRQTKASAQRVWQPKGRLTMHC